MNDLVLDRLTRSRADRAALHAEYIGSQVRIELARSRRIADLREKTDAEHARARAQITAAAGPAIPALIRRVRDVEASSSPRERARRAQLQDLANRYARIHGDTGQKQTERRELLATATRPADKATR